MRTVLFVLALATPAAAQCLTATQDCTERVTSQGAWISVYRSHPLAGPPLPSITRAFVLIHGTNRNADDYYAHALASTVTAGQLPATVVVAPEFRANAGGCRDTLDTGQAAWTCEGWKSGLASSAGPTSYEYIDRLLENFADREHFPNLKEIVIAGHSAGGQFVQRYAGATTVDQQTQVPVRFVVANPSSYVYLNALRLRHRSTCSEDGSCTGAFTQYWDAGNCTTFNRYKYGLEQLEGYLKQAGEQTIVSQYPKKNITYMVGAQDNIRDSGLELSCPALAQGANRNERGIIFWNYIRQHFNANHRLAIISGCGHSAACMFTTPSGASVVFTPVKSVSAAQP